MPIPPNPLNLAVLTRPTPEAQDVLLFEEIDPRVDSYVALGVGSDHADVANYAGYKLCKEETLAYDRNRRWWATSFVNQDIYNYGISYDAESNSFPAYTRRYVERRDQYAARTKGAAFTGVWQLAVTLGGSGYLAATPPTVTISSGGGSGATARAVVNNAGAVCWLTITAEGTGYTSTPTVAIAAPTAGVTATGSATIQTAKLTKEDLREFADDDPRRSIFVIVDRVYETLPGAPLDTWRLSLEGKTIRTRVQKFLSPVYPASGGALQISDQVEARDANVAIRRTEQWMNSSGSSLNVPPFRILTDTIEPQGVQLKTWITTVTASQELPEIGAASMTINGVVYSLAVTGGRRRIASFPTPVSGGGTWENANAYVVGAERRAIEDSDNFVLIVQTCPIPNAIYTFMDVPFTFPAVLAGTGTAAIVNGHVILNAGVTYRSHRTNSYVGCRIRRYSAGPFVTNFLQAPNALRWKIEAPGAGAGFFSLIDRNTIHPAFSATDADGNTEFFDASTPAALPTYYLLKGEQDIWKGNIYEREYIIVQEAAGIENVADSGTPKTFEAGGAFPCP